MKNHIGKQILAVIFLFIVFIGGCADTGMGMVSAGVTNGNSNSVQSGKEPTQVSTIDIPKQTPPASGGGNGTTPPSGGNNGTPPPSGGDGTRSPSPTDCFYNWLMDPTAKVRLEIVDNHDGHKPILLKESTVLPLPKSVIANLDLWMVKESWKTGFGRIDLRLSFLVNEKIVAQILIEGTDLKKPGDHIFNFVLRSKSTSNACKMLPPAPLQLGCHGDDHSHHEGDADDEDEDHDCDGRENKSPSRLILNLSSN